MSDAEAITFRPRVLALAMAIATVGVAPPFLVGALSEQMEPELGYSKTGTGLLIALGFAGGALTSVPAGRIVQRVGATAGQRLGGSLAAVAMLVIAVFGRSLGSLVPGLLIAGLANSTTQTAANLAVTRGAPIERRALAFALKQSAIPASVLLGGLAVPSIGLTVGWRWAFVLLAAAATVCVGLVPELGHGTTTPRGDGARYDAPRRAMVWLAIGVGCGAFAANALGGFFVGAAVNLGTAEGLAGVLAALGAGATIATRVVVGQRADAGQADPFSTVASLQALGALGFLLMVPMLPGVFHVGAVLAFTAGWGWPGLFNHAVTLHNPTSPAAATGFTQTGVYVGAGVGPFVFGWLVSDVSWTAGWAVVVCAALAASLAVSRGRSLLGG